MAIYNFDRTALTTSNGAIDVDILKTSITNAILPCSVWLTDEIHIDFTDEIVLSPSQELSLAVLIAQHDPTPPKFRLSSSAKLEFILQIQYDRIGLQKKKFPCTKGELRVVEYYEQVEPEIIDGSPTGNFIYTNLVVREDNTWTYTSDPARPLLKLPVSRTTEIKYYLTNGTLGYTKVATHFYNFAPDIFTFVADRHNNILADAKGYIMSQNITWDQAEDLLDDFAIPMTKYVAGNGIPLATAIMTSTRSYLTEEMRSALIDIISY